MTNEGEGHSRTPDKENTLPHPHDEQVGVNRREVAIEEDFDPETCFKENPFNDTNDCVHSSVFPFTRSTEQSYLTVIDSMGNSRRLIVRSNREMDRKV